MIRKLSAAICLACAALPINVYALGLGEIHTSSSLNQAFSSNIDLLSVKPGEVDGIKVVLASADAFSRSGVTRPFFLSKLKFTPKVLANGKTVIHVTSRDAVREPFLNFLVEVNWPNGRLVREYTVLLDPPVTLGRKPASVTSPTIASRNVIQRGKTAKTSGSAGKVRATTRSTSGERYRVRKGDTLWGIAKDTKKSPVSTEQMALAYFRNNKAAFSDGNINALKAGSILRIPTKDDATGIAKSTARNEFLQAANAWRADQASTNARSVSSGKEISVSNKVVDHDARLSIATARPDGDGLAGAAENDAKGTQARTTQDMLMAEEEAAAVKAENIHLRTQVTDLKDQMDKLERLINLKNEQLARMQVKGALDAQGKSVLDQAVERQALKEETDLLAEEILADQVAVEQRNADIAKIEGTEEGVNEPAELAEVVDELVPLDIEEEVAVEPTTIPEPINTPKPISQAKRSGGIIDWVMSNAMIAGAGLLGLFALFGLGWMLIRNRNKDDGLDMESILLTDDEHNESDILSEVLTDSVVHDANETSFLSDFSPSDIDALQDDTGEVDPMSEADVYIAYGRYQQAEDLIKQAIDKGSDRPALKHKLLEIHYSTRDKEKFVAVAEQMAASGLDEQDPTAWNRAASMGHELAPEHVLFVDAVDSPSELNTGFLDEKLSNDVLPSVDDLSNLDLSSLSMGIEDETTRLATDSEVTAAGVDNVNVDLDIDLPDSSMTSFETDEDSLIIDLPDDLSDLTETDSILPLSEDDDLSELLVDDSVLPLSDVDETDNISSISGLANDSSMLGSLDSMSLLSEDSTLADLDAAIGDDFLTASLGDNSSVLSILDSDSEPFSLDGISSLNLDEDSILANLDLDETSLAGSEFDSFNADTLDTIDEDSVMSSLLDEDYGDIDEISTKLDLARAYIGMGDKSGAKSILSEVLGEGSDDQKKEANSLLADIA